MKKLALRVLEDYTDVRRERRGRYRIRIDAVDPNGSFHGRGFRMRDETGERKQEGRLSAARRTAYKNELPLLHRETDVPKYDFTAERDFKAVDLDSRAVVVLS